MSRPAKMNRFLFNASRFHPAALGFSPGTRNSRRDRSNKETARAKGMNPGPGLWILSRESLKDSKITKPAKMEKNMAASLSGWILISFPSLLRYSRSAAHWTEGEDLSQTTTSERFSNRGSRPVPGSWYLQLSALPQRPWARNRSECSPFPGTSW